MSTESAEQAFKYWAFICYAPEDEQWSTWLHQALETYGLPRILQGKPSRFGPLPKRLFPVFRDRDELPLGPVEGDQIEAALRWSRTLIVICSPAAVGSPEVDRQIRFFKSLGREREVFCLIVDGKAAAKPEIPPEDFLPKAARFQLGARQEPTATPAKPLIVDARRGKDGKFNARLKLVAAIIGCGFADLKQRDVDRAQRRMQVVLSIVMIVFAVIVVLGVQLYFEKNRAEQERIHAESARERAEAAEQRARRSAAQALAAQKQEAAARKQAERARSEAVEALEQAEAREKAKALRESPK